MNNVYLQIIQLWLYVHEVLKTNQKGYAMAGEPQTVSESLNIDLAKLTNEAKVDLIDEIFDTLTVQDLSRVRDIVEDKREEKLEIAKQQVIEEMKGKFAQLGLSYDEAIGLNKRNRKRRKNESTLVAKYRSPTGETWSGRGHAPQWLRELETAGHDREEYRI